MNTTKLIAVSRGLGVAACLIIYTLLVHHVNTSGQQSALGACLALLPIFTIALGFALKNGSRLLALAVVLSFSIASWLLWSLIKQYASLIFWMLDVGLMLSLMMTFGLTLLSGRKPLCVFFAEIINGGTLPADHEIYARRVTIAWVVFFAAISITSTLLFFLTSLTTWSFFVNFLTLPLVALMFIVEFILRNLLLTDLPTTHVLDAVKAYLDKSARAK